MRETINHPTTGAVLAELDFRNDYMGGMVANIDGGLLTRHGDGVIEIVLDDLNLTAEVASLADAFLLYEVTAPALPPLSRNLLTADWGTWVGNRD